MNKLVLSLAAGFLFFASWSAPASAAPSAKEIDARADRALQLFQTKVLEGKDILARAKAVLIFPKVIKAGIGIGGEYGTGVLRINGKSVEYYNTILGSFGFQLGGQVKSVFLIFMDDAALKDFRTSDGWKAGVNGSIALIKVGFDGSVDTLKTDEPIVGFVLNQRGLMYNLTLEGSKYSKIRAV